MISQRSNAFLGLLFACSSLLGCSGAEWQKVEIESPYEAPKTLTITVVAPREAQEAAQALSSALVSELKNGGVNATVISSSDKTPEMELVIAKWEPGSQGLRWLIGFGAGEGEIVITVEAATIGVKGSARGWVTGGVFGGDAGNSASAAGHLIGRTILTGERDSRARDSKALRASDY